MHPKACMHALRDGMMIHSRACIFYLVTLLFGKTKKKLSRVSFLPFCLATFSVYVCNNDMHFCGYLVVVGEQGNLNDISTRRKCKLSSERE